MNITCETTVSLDERHLHALWDEAQRRARRYSRPILVSAIRPIPPGDPLAFFAHGAPNVRDRLFWSAPDAAYTLAGWGVAWSVETPGPHPGAEAAAAWRTCYADALIDADAEALATGPLLLGGFAFNPRRPTTPLWQGYPAGRLALPRYMVTCADDSCWLTINVLVRPDSAPAAEIAALLRHLPRVLDSAAAPLPPAPSAQELIVADGLPAEEWMAIVAAAVQQLQRGDLEKVVLARECRVQGQRPFDAAATLARLRADYPNCFGFAVARGDRCFLGASPERLVRLRDGAVWATSLAGSIRRGATEEEDRQLGATLLASAKERAEHAIVVRALSAALADLCTNLEVPDTPTLMKMRNVQHLFTPITGRLAGDYAILDLVERLHPTPAVGGTPRDLALRLIRERERMDRGWYAGPVGWLDTRGEGEFAVALRSALLHGAAATLFAGCGIVADSDPESEYAESRLKLRPLLTALGRTTL